MHRALAAGRLSSAKSDAIGKKINRALGVLSLEVEVEIWQSSVNLHMSFQLTTNFEQLNREKEAQMNAQLPDPSANIHIDVFMWYLVLIEMIRDVGDKLLCVLQLMTERLGDKHMMKESL